MLSNQVSVLKFQEGMSDLCDKTSISTEAINQTVINVRNYTTYLESNNMRLVVLIASLILFAFHLLESISNCNKVTTNFLSFFSGHKAIDCQDTDRNIPEQIPLEDLQEELEERLWQRQDDIIIQRVPAESHRKVVTNVAQILLSFLGLILVIFISCIPQLFDLYRIEIESSSKLAMLISMVSYYLVFFIFLQLILGNAKAHQDLIAFSHFEWMATS